MPYIYNVSLVIEDEIEDLDTQYSVDEIVEQSIERIKQAADIDVDYVSAQIVDLVNFTNYGKCSICKAWVSDYKKKNSVREFSDGIMIDGEWFCDNCLPHNHPRHF